MLAPDKTVFTKKTAGEKILHNTRNRWSSQTSESMMHNGTLWQAGKKTIDDYSVHNYHALRIALGKLTIQEQTFFNTLSQAPFYAVHCTDSLDVVNKNNDLILYSRKELISKRVRFNTDNTQPIDISMLGNDGYVFFFFRSGFTITERPKSLWQYIL